MIVLVVGMFYNISLLLQTSCNNKTTYLQELIKTIIFDLKRTHTINHSLVERMNKLLTPDIDIKTLYCKLLDMFGAEKLLIETKLIYNKYEMMEGDIRIGNKIETLCHAIDFISNNNTISQLYDEWISDGGMMINEEGWFVGKNKIKNNPNMIGIWIKAGKLVDIEKTLGNKWIFQAGICKSDKLYCILDDGFGGVIMFDGEGLREVGDEKVGDDIVLLIYRRGGRW